MRRSELFVAFLLGLAVLLSLAQSEEIVNLSVSDVVIYPESVALVEETGNAKEGECVGIINKGAYTDSIRVVGAREVSVMESNEWGRGETINQLLEQLVGEFIGVGEVNGTLEWLASGWLGISSGSSFFALPVGSITRIESLRPLDEPNETANDGINVSWRGSPGSVKVRYLSSGLSWSPVYFLDAGEASSRFEFWAKVVNQFEDIRSRIRLIGGDVHILHPAYPVYRNVAYAKAAVPEDTGMGQEPTVSRAGEYEVYDLGEKELKMGESRMVSIFAGSVKPEKEYLWNTDNGDVVRRVYIIKNTGRAWPEGRVRVFENGILMGEDRIEWTPSGEKARVTVGNALDIDVSKRVSRSKTGLGEYIRGHNTVTLELKNNKDTPVTVRIVDRYPSYIQKDTFSSDFPFVQKPGNVIEGNVTLGAGEKRDITYTYSTAY